MAPKTLSEDELKKIVGRAQELQDEANTHYTTTEAQDAAARLGIAPEYVNAALAEKTPQRPLASPPSAPWGLLSWVVVILVLVPFVGGFSWWVWGTIIRVEVREVPFIVEVPVDSKLAKAFADQLALLEESRPIIGSEAAALDELVLKFRASPDLQEKIAIMLRLNRGLHDPVFFRSPIGNAKAESIMQENSRLHTIFFFAKDF